MVSTGYVNGRERVFLIVIMGALLFTSFPIIFDREAAVNGCANACRMVCYDVYHKFA